MLELRKLLDKSFLISVRESFIALLPFILVNSFLSLIIALVDLWAPTSWLSSSAYHGLVFFSAQLSRIFPLLALISLSFHFSKYLQQSAIVVCSLSLGILLALHVPTEGGALNTTYVENILGDPRLVILPILTAYVMRTLSVWKILQIVDGKALSVYLKQHINHFLPVVLCFIILFFSVELISTVLDWLFHPFINVLNEANSSIQLFIRILLTHIFWLFGVHGDNAYLLLIGIDNGLMPIFPNLTNSQFMDLFILYGGSGATFSLIIAIFIGAKDTAIRHIAKISAPFALFNINEILIYGLPIIFNPRLMVPFVLSPVINFLLAYTALSYDLLHFNGHYFPWITPPLLNAYIASGHVSAVLFQIGLIVLGVLIYLPFVKRFSLMANSQEFDNELIKRVQFKADIDRMTEKKYLQKQSESLKAEMNLEKTIKEVLAGELQLHYQPKLSVTTNQVVGFEALLRLKDQDGEIRGPYFIDAFQRAGYSHIIDHFVINTVADDIACWELEGFMPKVSINLDPNNLIDPQLMAMLTDRLGTAANRIEIEMLESAFMLELTRIDNCMGQLQQLGFTFLLDDFGTGFSSLSLLSRINVNGIKLDRSILANTDDPKGKTLYIQICHLCNRLGFSLIAEGVETEVEAEFVRAAGVSYVQGWLYAKALPSVEAKAFSLARAGEHCVV